MIRALYVLLISVGAILYINSPYNLAPLGLSWMIIGAIELHKEEKA